MKSFDPDKKDDQTYCVFSKRILVFGLVYLYIAAVFLTIQIIYFTSMDKYTKLAFQKLDCGQDDDVKLNQLLTKWKYLTEL